MIEAPVRPRPKKIDAQLEKLTPAKQIELFNLLKQLPKYNRFQLVYHDDPVAFSHDCIDWSKGDQPTFYQDEILDALVTYSRVCVRGPHGLGKTGLASWAILWFALTRDSEDWKAPLTASAWRQLSHFLLPEIHKWARKLKWEKIGRDPFNLTHELQKLSIKLKTGEAFAVASDTPELMEGAHADSLFYMFDEAKAIPQKTFDATEGAFSNAGKDTKYEAFALAVSTPGTPQGQFYKIQKREAGYEDWWVRAVTLEECIKAGRISNEWVAQRRKQWGEESAVFQNRVLGEFASNEENGVIPLSWVEKANARWLDWKDNQEEQRERKLTALGADIAESGEDKTVFALLYDDKRVEALKYYSRAELMETANRLSNILESKPDVRLNIDVIGVGAGVVSRLRELGQGKIWLKSINPFHAAERAETTDSSGELGFNNKRSAAWWHLRELLDPANAHDIALPPDDLLTGDLTAPNWKEQAGGKIQVESKPDIKKRLGRSTDSADAVIMAFYKPKKKKVLEAL